MSFPGGPPQKKMRLSDRDGVCLPRSDLPFNSLSVSPNVGNTYYQDDPYTTNLFLSNLSQDVVEADIIQVFGRFGPLASVKVMYPRNDEERLRGFLCGFVAFMVRVDADRAVIGLEGRGALVKSPSLRMSWAEAVDLPACPIYQAEGGEDGGPWWWADPEEEKAIHQQATHARFTGQGLQLLSSHGSQSLPQFYSAGTLGGFPKGMRGEEAQAATAKLKRARNKAAKEAKAKKAMHPRTYKFLDQVQESFGHSCELKADQMSLSDVEYL